MATDQDLMGFGLNALLASRMADCSSSVTIIPAASGSTYATSTKIQGNQFFTMSTTAGGGWLGVPTATTSSDNMPRIADDFTFLNAVSGGPVTLAAPTGTTLWVAGVATSQATVAAGHTFQFILANTTNWACFAG